MAQQQVSGIDAVETYIPKLYIDYRDFAEWRLINPEKMKDGLGIRKMAIPDSNQDVATMAANSVLRLMVKNSLRPEDVASISVATETSLDESKALNSYVIGMLNQVYGQDAFSHAGGVEHKFACVSGAYAINSSLDSVLVGRTRGKASIVVMTDIAKYGLKSPGEQTQGSGAVALLIKQNPRLIAIDPRMSASDTGDDYDFYRPTGKETPYVEGLYSKMKYLIRVGRAYNRFKKLVIEDKLIDFDPKREPLFEHIDYFVPHLPFPEMGQTLLAALIVGEVREGFKPRPFVHPLPMWKEIEKQFGGDAPEMSMALLRKISEGKQKTNFDLARVLSEDKDYMSKWKDYINKIKDSQIYQRLFSEKLESALEISSIVGNIYTGSMPLGVRSMLEFDYRKGIDLAGKRVIMLAYGSGSNSTILTGQIQDEYSEPVKNMNIDDEIGPRRRLSLEEYESLHTNLRSPENPLQDYKNEFVLVSSKGNDEMFPKRQYAFNGHISEIAYIK